jgi:hypothetical protein
MKKPLRGYGTIKRKDHKLRASKASGLSHREKNDAK